MGQKVILVMLPSSSGPCDIHHENTRKIVEESTTLIPWNKKQVQVEVEKKKEFFFFSDFPLWAPFLITPPTEGEKGGF